MENRSSSPPDKRRSPREVLDSLPPHPPPRHDPDDEDLSITPDSDDQDDLTPTDLSSSSTMAATAK